MNRRHVSTKAAAKHPPWRVERANSTASRPCPCRAQGQSKIEKGTSDFGRSEKTESEPLTVEVTRPPNSCRHGDGTAGFAGTAGRKPPVARIARFENGRRWRSLWGHVPTEIGSKPVTMRLGIRRTAWRSRCIQEKIQRNTGWLVGCI